MKLVLVYLSSFFPVIILGTKCLQCSHSVDKPNNPCIDGTVTSRKCPTDENSCLISMMTNASSESGEEISFLKFSRLCSLLKKEDDGNCEVKDGVLKCFCNGDGCNVIPAKLLISDRINKGNYSVPELNDDMVIRHSRTPSSDTCSDTVACTSADEKCVVTAPGVGTAPATKTCQGLSDRDAVCYKDVALQGGNPCRDVNPDDDNDCVNLGATDGYQCKGPANSGEPCFSDHKHPCAIDGDKCETDPDDPSKKSCQVDSEPDYVEQSTLEPTPVLTWVGTQNWGTYHHDNKKECWNHSAIAKIIRGWDTPDKKKKLLEEHTCRLDYGLECLNITDDTVTPPQFKHACRCLLSLGPKPALYNAPNPSSSDEDVKYGTNTQCFIPAGKGYASECFASQPRPEDDEDVKKRLPPYETFGFPLPYGDPAGVGPDPPHLTDIFNPNSVKENAVQYIAWNTIFPRCPPNAECREAGTYIGKRCQCIKGAILVRSTGLCNYAAKISVNLGLFLALYTALFLFGADRLLI